MYVVNDLSIGGAEMMLYKLLAETRRERFAPVVVCLSDGGGLRERIESLGIEVHSAGMKPGRPTPLGLWRLIRLARRLRPRLIIGWMYHSCLAAQLANFFSLRRTPLLWSIHYSTGSLAAEKWLTAAVIRACALLSRLPARIIFVSRAGQTQHGPLGYSLANSCVIPNGIDVTEFTPSAEARGSVRRELGFAGDAFLIGLVGRYHWMKDHANFLRAAALLAETHPRAHFLLSGRGVDPDNRELTRTIRESGLAGRTHLLGERHDIPRLAAALDVFTLSSSHGESFPNVIGEAMACAVPCVVTDLGDAGWMVGDTGRVVPPRDPRALADAWREMIEFGPEGRAGLGRAARLRVTEQFLLASVVARYEAMYETVLAAGTPAETTAPGLRRERAGLPGDDGRDAGRARL